MNKREIQAYGEWQQELTGISTFDEKWQAVPAAVMLITENVEEIEGLKTDSRIKELLLTLQQKADAVFFGAWRTDAALPSADDLSEKVRGELTVALHREISRVRPKLIISFGDFLLKTLTKRLDFQIDLAEDQLYMIDLAGHSYCLYPMPEVSRPDWEQALDKLERIDFLRLRKILNEFAAARAGETAGVSESREKKEKRGVLPELSKTGDKSGNKRMSEPKNAAADRATDKTPVLPELPIDRQARKAGKKLVIIDADREDTAAGYACGRAAEVFTELGLTVETWKLAETADEEVLAALTQAAGVVIALTVEWYGIGSRLQRFLESCHAAKPKDILAEMPLLAIVFSRDCYEREAAAYLTQAWRLLGGWPELEITGVFAEVSDFSENRSALEVIEKKAEQFFRYGLNQSYQLPQSAAAGQIGQPPQAAAGMAAETPEAESVQREKANVKALSHKLQAKLEQKTRQTKQSLAELILQNYVGGSEQEYRLQLMVKDKPAENTFVLIKKTGVYAYAGEEEAVLTIFAEDEILRRCLVGELSFQKAFMTGQLSAKGELTLLYKLEDFFRETH